MRLADLLGEVDAWSAALASQRGAPLALARSGTPLLALCGPRGKPMSVVPGDIASVRICDITEDSRTVVPGSLFIARKGLKSDGKAFIDAALQAGAAAILTDDASAALHDRGVPVLITPDAPLASAMVGEVFYGTPSSRVGVVGVTGTNGKTTTTYLLWQLCNLARVRAGLVGTVMIDDGVEVARAMMTTPPAIEVSRTLARMDEAGVRVAAMEISSHALDQRRADALSLRVAIFSNLTGDHLDYHGTMERYAQAKARLFALLPASGVALVNMLDPWHEHMIRECVAPVRRLAVLAGASLHDIPKGCDYACCVLAQSMQGMRLLVKGPFGERELRTSLVGRFNAFNLLAAFAAACEMGLSIDALAQGVERLTAPPGRLERVSATDAQIHVFVDYAHSDDSLANVLAAVAGVMPQRHAGEALDTAAGAPSVMAERPRLWCVFGCGGDRDATKRPRMGKVASTIADRTIVTSDNPRRERPSDIVDQVLAGIPSSVRGRVQVQVDRQRAIHAAIEQAQPGDVVVIAGKGHETEQVLPDGQGGTISTHFDDREVARAALQARGIPTLPTPQATPSAARRVPSVESVLGDEAMRGVAAPGKRRNA